MYENLNKKFDEIFKDIPNTKAAKELKDELLGNLIDRYNDLVNEGKDEKEAIEIAIDGIGDVDELFKGLEEKEENYSLNYEKERKKHALVLTIAIGVYIMSVIVYMLLAEVFQINEDIASCVMMFMCGLATCALVYNHSSRPRYLKKDNTMVEEFKEWKNSSTNEKQVLSSIKSIVWLMTIVIYIFVSFSFGIWSYSWIIFLIGAAIEKFLTLYFQLKK